VTATLEPAAPATPARGRRRALPRPPVRVVLVTVLAWHAIAVVFYGWVAYNIFGAVWRLESLPRTAIGIGAVIGLLANGLSILLIALGARAARMVSFTTNYLTLVVVIVALFQSMSLATYLDTFAASFNAAFIPFIGVALAGAWYLVARRLLARLDEPGGPPPPAWVHGLARGMRVVGIVAMAGFGLWWIWALDIPGLLSALSEGFRGSTGVNALLVIALLGLLWCCFAMWSTRMAAKYDASADQLEAQSGWLFLSPNLVGFLLFFAGPLAFSLVISFYEWDGITTPTFVGLGNYIDTLGLTIASSAAALPDGYQELISQPFGDGVIGASDPLFWRSMFNIIVFLVLAVPLAVVPALVLAALINTGYRGTKVFRTIFFVPAVAGVIGVTLIWKQMFNSTVGFVNYVIGAFNGFVNAILPGDPLPDPVEIGWLSDPSVALFAVVIVFAWSQFGFNTVLFMAGMQGIPREMHEAAELDGAGPWRRFFSITLPSLRATTFFVVASTVILALQLFDIVYALNQPNPVGFPDNATLTPVVYLYQLGFQQDSFGQASAVAWVLFVIIFIFTLAQFRMQRSDAEVK
jgi:ABC-type sugar transport system permease subunit